MSVSSFSVAEAATSLAVTGGTSVAYATDGQTVTNGVHCADQSETDLRLQPHVTFKTRRPAKQANGSFSKGVLEAIWTFPYEKSDGTIAYNVERYKKEFDPETPVSTLNSNRLIFAQMLSQAAFTAWHQTGTIA